MLRKCVSGFMGGGAVREETDLEIEIEERSTETEIEIEIEGEKEFQDCFSLCFYPFA